MKKNAKPVESLLEDYPAYQKGFKYLRESKRETDSEKSKELRKKAEHQFKELTKKLCNEGMLWIDKANKINSDEKNAEEEIQACFKNAESFFKTCVDYVKLEEPSDAQLRAQWQLAVIYSEGLLGQRSVFWGLKSYLKLARMAPLKTKLKEQHILTSKYHFALVSYFEELTSQELSWRAQKKKGITPEEPPVFETLSEKERTILETMTRELIADDPQKLFISCLDRDALNFVPKDLLEEWALRYPADCGRQRLQGCYSLLDQIKNHLAIVSKLDEKPSYLPFSFPNFLYKALWGGSPAELTALLVRQIEQDLTTVAQIPLSARSLWVEENLLPGLEKMIQKFPDQFLKAHPDFVENLEALKAEIKRMAFSGERSRQKKI